LSMITTEMIKTLRQATGAGVLDCKKALEATGGDFDKAVEHIQEKGLAAATKKAGRAANEGIIEAYIHAGGGQGAILELNCETDFVARTPDFHQLAHDLAMQVVASRPLYLSLDDVPPEVLEAEREKYRAQALEEGKPERIVERIVAGRMKKFLKESCLLEQPFIKDEDMTVEELIRQAIVKLGENIVVHRFSRYEVGEEE
jgi:elongation factor Ts